MDQQGDEDKKQEDDMTIFGDEDGHESQLFRFRAFSRVTPKDRKIKKLNRRINSQATSYANKMEQAQRINNRYIGNLMQLGRKQVQVMRMNQLYKAQASKKHELLLKKHSELKNLPQYINIRQALVNSQKNRVKVQEQLASMRKKGLNHQRGIRYYGNRLKRQISSIKNFVQYFNEQNDNKMSSDTAMKLPFRLQLDRNTIKHDLKLSFPNNQHQIFTKSVINGSNAELRELIADKQGQIAILKGLKDDMTKQLNDAYQLAAHIRQSSYDTELQRNKQFQNYVNELQSNQKGVIRELQNERVQVRYLKKYVDNYNLYGTANRLSALQLQNTMQKWQMRALKQRQLAPSSHVLEYAYAPDIGQRQQTYSRNDMNKVYEKAHQYRVQQLKSQQKYNVISQELRKVKGDHQQVIKKGQQRQLARSRDLYAIAQGQRHALQLKQELTAAVQRNASKEANDAKTIALLRQQLEQNSTINGIQYGQGVISIDNHEDSISLGIKFTKRDGSHFFTNQAVKVNNKFKNALINAIQQALSAPIKQHQKFTKTVQKGSIIVTKDFYKDKWFLGIRQCIWYAKTPHPTRNGFNLTLQQAQMLVQKLI